MPPYDEVLTDAVAVTEIDEELIAHYATVIESSVRVIPLITATTAYSFTTSEVITVAETLASLTGINLYELLTLSEPHIVNSHFHMEVGERAALTEQLLRALPQTLSEAVSVTAQSIAARAVTLIDSLGLVSVLTPSLRYGYTITDGIRVAAAIARFFGADALDALAVADTPIGDAYKALQMMEAVTIGEDVAPRLLLNVQVADDVHIDDVDLVRMAFNGTIIDGLEITAGFILPGAAFTTWVMNTRTAAVSEYRNYAFNSFARIGNVYVGASDTGLYELLGNTDDGAGIVATIRSGFAQWAGTHLHSFKAAYLAVRGSGDFVLRVITPDGKTYNYTVTAQSMKAVKVNMGKGLRSRYFAFELISTGQDFDLESLEFVPLVAQRRV